MRTDKAHAGRCMSHILKTDVMFLLQHRGGIRRDTYEATVLMTYFPLWTLMCTRCCMLWVYGFIQSLFQVTCHSGRVLIAWYHVGQYIMHVSLRMDFVTSCGE